MLESHVLKLGRTLIETAHTSAGLVAWQTGVFTVLGEIGFDVAFLKATPPRFAFVATGFDPEVLANMRLRGPVYAKELDPLTEAAKKFGVVSDRDIYGSGRERLAYYQDLVRPQRGTSSIYAHLAIGNQEVGGVMLGRSGREFSRDDIHALHGLLAPLSVGLAAVLRDGAIDGRDEVGLSPREGEVLRLVQLGYTNPEIGRALGTSPNTVRNQVAALLAKVGATNRAELVALTLRP